MTACRVISVYDSNGAALEGTARHLWACRECGCAGCLKQAEWLTGDGIPVGDRLVAASLAVRVCELEAEAKDFRKARQHYDACCFSAGNKPSELLAEVSILRQCIEVVRKGWTKGQPSSMNLVIGEVEELLSQLCTTCAEGKFARMVLDEDGVMTTVSGKPGRWGHSFSDCHWYCGDNPEPRR